MAPSPTHPPAAELVATLTTPPAEDGSSLAALGAVDWIEVRADLVGDLDPRWIRQHTGARLLYTLRSRAEGGKGEDHGHHRRQRLRQAAAATTEASGDGTPAWDALDLEVERDLDDVLLAALEPTRRVLSWHGSAAPSSSDDDDDSDSSSATGSSGSSDLTALRRRFDAMAEVPAALYKLVPAARQAGQELPPLLLLHQLQRRDVTAFATGALASWTRPLTPRLGAPWIYCGATAPAAPGQLSLHRLRQDFGLPALPPVEALFGLAGHPVHHSLSPRLHNAAYRALGLPYLYVPFHAEHFGDFWIEVAESRVLRRLGFPLRGLSVTAPHKAVALAVAGATSPLAETIGGANTLVRRERVWEAESTDPAGVLLPLIHRGLPIRGARAAVVGCGGAGRAAAVGLARAGAEVTLVNRTVARGQEASRHLHLPFVSLADFDPTPFDILVNATHLGHNPSDPPPFDLTALRASAAVVDLVYRPEPTPLVQQARHRGLVAIDGREVLLFQAVDQFRLMTGTPLPPELIRQLAQDVLLLDDLPDDLGPPSG